jgi:Calcineurin-like phosphoesterase
MVGWYDPGQLINTGIQVLISQILGARADYRLIESFSGPDQVHDFSHQEECWFDYVADLGDGWNPTYAVALMLASERLSVRSTDGKTVNTQRGKFLIMGGDQVYPVADRDQYQERMVAPYSSALPASQEPHPALFAIPGNHDWYDGLISFMRLFARGRCIGGWQTRQKRSYFAIRLPQNWWVWALDYQLESDIDQPQLEFFNQVADQMPKGASVILVSAEPDWVYGHIYHEKYRKNIEDLQTKIINQRAHATLKVAVAGDLHHYRRHESVDASGVQLITSGGGGAFLLGTTGPKVDEVDFGHPPKQFKLKCEFPGRKTSARLLLRNLIFPLINPKFGFLTGTMYLVIAWIYRVPVLREYEALLKRSDPVSNTIIIVRTLLASPFGFGVLALVVIGFVAFTDTHVRAYKYLAGTAHALANLGAIFLISAAAAKLGRDLLHLPDGSIRSLLVSAFLIFFGGYLAGAIIMGIYLYISQAVFRRHSQEAFSSLRIADYKSFLRFHIDATRALNIYAIGLDRIPRHWERAAPSGPEYVPRGGDRLNPRMIEPVLRVR